MISIVDSGGANISSIQFALNRLGVEAQLTDNSDRIKNSSHIILPGVGSAGSAMKTLQKEGLIEVIQSLTQPVLGICLGMQLLFEYSEENDTDCLGIIPGKIKKIQCDENQIIVPHMGWNTIDIIDDAFLLKNVSQGSYVYFVHSYGAAVGSYTAAKTYYGSHFSAVVSYKNFHGTQFHPERSSSVGSDILKNFLEL